MYLPERPLSSNFTTPSTSANKVSSLPRPTFLPGFHLVPRCRARILPPSTASPPNFFRPNRCELESRPLRDDPTPFLCAISHFRFAIADFRLMPRFQSAIGNWQSAILPIRSNPPSMSCNPDDDRGSVYSVYGASS